MTRMTRVYELMVIFDREVDESTIDGLLNQVSAMIGDAGGRVATTDKWGLRKYAYEINHKDEGYYVVLEIVTEATDLHDVDRFLRLADETVRHKAIRLPDAEALRRGLLGDGAPAEAAG
jgi:small subunit ribosomal protein S6